MHIVLYLFAIYGISTFIKDMDGPFDIMQKTRIRLMQNKYMGVFFYKLLSCYFCVGAYAGIIVYFLHNRFRHFNIFELIIWVFASAAVSMFTNLIVGKLLENNNGQ